MAITQPFTGIGTGIGIGEESTWGTAVSRTNWMPATDSGSDLQRKQIREVVPELVQGDNYDVKNTFLSMEQTEGGFEVLARYDGIGMLLKAILWGTPSTSGTSSPYTHTYGMGTSHSGLTVEVIRGTTGKSDVAEGFVVNEATISGEAGKPIRIAVQGQAETMATRGNAGTPTYTTGQLVLASQADTATFNGGAVTLESFEITINNGLSRVSEVGRLTTAHPPVSNFREVRATATINMRAETLATAYQAGTTGDLVIVAAGDSPNQMTITVKNCEMMDYGDAITGSDIVKIQLELLGRAASSADSIEIEIINGTASATAN